MKTLLKDGNNKGLTLLELIISVAIMSVVIATVTSFMVTGMRMYGSSHNEIQMQEEVQLALNNVENRIIDAKKGVRCDNYTLPKPSPSPSVTPSGSGTYEVVVLTVFNDESSTDEGKEYIFWDENDKKIYYDFSKGTETRTPATFSKAEVLADHVTDFEVVMKEVSKKANASVTGVPTGTGIPTGTAAPSASPAPKKPQVDISIAVAEKGGRHFESTKTVSFRNNIAVNAKEDTVYTGTGNGQESRADKVIVTPNTANIVPGNSYQFQARVVGVGYPSQAVKWLIMGNPQGVSINDSGSVTVTDAVAVDTVTVKAETIDGAVSGTAQLKITKIDDIILTADTSKIYAGTLLKVNTQVIGSNMTDEMSKVTYSIINGDGHIRLYSEGGIFGLDNEARGNTYTIRATSLYDNSKYGELTFKVEDTAISGTSENATVNRGEAKELITNLTGDNLAASELKIDWSITNDGGLGSKVGINPATGVFSAVKDINYEKDYQVEVKAVISADRLSNPVEKLIQVTIPAVSINFTGSDAVIKKNGSVTLPYEVVGLAAAPSDIYAATNPSLKNSIIYVANDGVKLSIGDNVKASEFDVIATFKGTNTSTSIKVRVE